MKTTTHQALKALNEINENVLEAFDITADFLAAFKKTTEEKGEFYKDAKLKQWKKLVGQLMIETNHLYETEIAKEAK